VLCEALEHEPNDGPTHRSSRTLALGLVDVSFSDVQRIMTSRLPHREPKLLHAMCGTACAMRYLPADESAVTDPAGAM
jgi:hypothetical protein